MKRRTVSISKAKAGLSDLVNGVAFAGEQIVIAWHGKPRAVLMPVSTLPGLSEAKRISDMKEALRMAARVSRSIARRQARAGRRPLPAWKEIAEMRRQRMAQLDP